MKRKFHIYRLVGLDFLAAFIAWLAFYFVRKHILQEDKGALDLTLLIRSSAIAIFWVFIYYFFGMYSEVYRKSRIKEIGSLFTTTLLGVVVVFFTLLLDDVGVNYYKMYYKTLLSYFGIQYFITLTFKLILITYIKNLVRTKQISFNTLLVGSGNKALEVYKDIENSYDTLGYKFIAYLSVNEDKLSLNKLLRRLGNIDNLHKVIRRCYIENVIIALEPEDYPKLKNILTQLEYYSNIQISITKDVYKELIGSIKVNQNFDVPLVEINQELLPPWQQNTKRVSDIIIALLVCGLGFPFFILIGLIIKLTSKGPILYKQERIGKEGKPFMIYKFRSMKVDAEKNGPALAEDKDDRITSIGRFMRKTRLDEFPQFWNVLIGDMSLVGPRPERQFFIDQIVKIAPHYRHLHKVKPGITSLGQVKYGYASTVEEMIERLKYDVMYIENMSFSMDMRVLLYTILVMIQGRGK